MVSKILYKEQKKLAIGINIRTNIKEHFTKDEFEFIKPGRWGSRIESYTKEYSIQYLEQNFEELIKTNDTSFIGYCYDLALYRRLTLPLKFVLSSKMRKDNNSVASLQLINDCHDLVMKYFEKIYPLDKNNINKRESISESLVKLIIRFWCAGYSLYGGMEKAINDEVLNEAVEISKMSRRVQLYVLGQFLRLDPNSPVKDPPQRSKSTSVIDKERSKWSDLKDINITDVFKEYCFGPLLSRTESPLNIEISINNSFRRVSQSKITVNTWQHHSFDLRIIIDILYSKKIYSVDFFISKGIKILLKDSKFSSYSNSTKNSIRSSLRQFLEFYIATNKIKSINLDELFPKSIRRKSTSYGKILNLGYANELIQTLLYDEKGIIDENNIIQFRCRRACLIQLATGQRVSEVCLLFPKSLYITDDNKFYLTFHKTKKRKKVLVEVEKDVVKWVNELKKMAPSEKIFAPEDRYFLGDGLSEYRLFANSKNNSVLTSDSINNFLADLQKRIHGDNIEKKNMFTTHDFRRMQVLFMVLTGKNKEQIQTRIGQSNASSLIPYLATNDPEYQNMYKSIYEEGVWGSVVTGQNETKINTRDIISQISNLSSATEEIEKSVRELINSSLENIKDIKITSESSNSFVPINIVSAGFPRKTHSCVANEVLNCGHTELSCFKCNKYKPDKESLMDHKAEVFRYMIMAIVLEHSHTEKLKRPLINIKITTINKSIEEVFKTLFSNGFGFDKNEENSIRKELQMQAKKFVKIYGNKVPYPNYSQAKKFLETGELP